MKSNPLAVLLLMISSLKFSISIELPLVDTVKLQNTLSGIALKNIAQKFYAALGDLECSGFDHVTGLPVFKILFGENRDFGGEDVCSISCGGICQSYQSLQGTGPPTTLYPWGCKCAADRCNAKGPEKPIGWQLSPTVIKCDPDTDCDNYCQGIDDENPNYSGFLCNWWNVELNKAFLIRIQSRLSPIRWCECCPQVDK